LAEASEWYEREASGLGDRFILEVERQLRRMLLVHVSSQSRCAMCVERD
jgi:hypothetical protein